MPISKVKIVRIRERFHYETVNLQSNVWFTQSMKPCGQSKRIKVDVHVKINIL
jgi:hypothetical protein